MLTLMYLNSFIFYFLPGCALHNNELWWDLTVIWISINLFMAGHLWLFGSSLCKSFWSLKENFLSLQPACVEFLLTSSPLTYYLWLLFPATLSWLMAVGLNSALHPGKVISIDDLLYLSIGGHWFLLQLGIVD